MEIQLPATLTAEYLSEYASEYPFERPGHVSLRFGSVEITQLPVTEKQHDRLTATGFYTDHEIRERELQEIVAGWLKERLG